MTSRQRVLVTGASGFIGSAIVVRLVAGGFDVTGVARDPEKAKKRIPAIDWVAGDFNRDLTAEDWLPRLAGVDAVVNCAGVLQDGLGDSLENVHITGADALFEAAERVGVRRLVQISAIGAEPDAATRFMSTKAEGDRRLRGRDLDWVILRPGLVIGRPVYGGMGMIRGIAALPLVTPVLRGAKPMQVIGLDDVAAEVARSLKPDAPTGVVYDLVHPQPNDLGAIIRRMRQWLGFKPIPAVELPAWTAVAIGRLGDAAGWLGWRAPIRTNAIRQTLAGAAGDPRRWIEETGTAPAPLHLLPDPGPATVQDRWHARLWALRPAALIALAVFWVLSGAIALWPGFGASRAVLADAGMSIGVAGLVVAATAALDIAIGIALCFKHGHRAALRATLVVSFAYLAGGSVVTPHLWLDPLAPLLKIVPQMMLALMLLATADDR